MQQDNLEKTPAGWFFDASGWLIIPLALFIVVLFPVIIIRANRAKEAGVTGENLLKAQKASNISMVLALFTAAYLVGVLIF